MKSSHERSGKACLRIANNTSPREIMKSTDAISSITSWYYCLHESRAMLRPSCESVVDYKPNASRHNWNLEDHITKRTTQFAQQRQQNLGLFWKKIPLDALHQVNQNHHKHDSSLEQTRFGKHFQFFRDQRTVWALVKWVESTIRRNK